MILYPPGVYRAEDDTDLLIDVMRRGDYALDRQVLDIGTGSEGLGHRGRESRRRHGDRDRPVPSGGGRDLVEQSAAAGAGLGATW